ncbi:hypothetical protein, partial [Aquipuribacter sp. MA13-6]|uniref:hypothetical protein n=1 Tax=Aquipuribacter sp. MA13-6 TaxID=3440839 RepID=UPI003EEEA516
PPDPPDDLLGAAPDDPRDDRRDPRPAPAPGPDPFAGLTTTTRTSHPPDHDWRPPGWDPTQPYPF